MITKLGEGNIKFKFKFRYIDTKRISIKNVYANDFFEALKLFNDFYKEYKIEIINLEREDLI